MALEVKKTITVGGETVKLSDTLDKIPLTQLVDASYSAYLDSDYQGAMYPVDNKYRFKVGQTDENAFPIVLIGNVNSIVSYSTKERQPYFYRNILLYFESGNWYDVKSIHSQSTNLSNMRVVLDVDIKKLRLGTDSSYPPLYLNGSQLRAYPCQIWENENGMYIGQIGQGCFGQINNRLYFSERNVYDGTKEIGFSVGSASQSGSWCYTTSHAYPVVPCPNVNYELMSPNFSTSAGNEVSGNEYIKVKFSNFDSGTIQFLTKNNENFMLRYIATGGLRYIRNGVTYKPLVENGYITGYVRDDDMETENEFNEWTNLLNHDVPSGPPAPPAPSGSDEYDAIGLTLNANGSSFLKNYAVTGDELIALLSWCNSADVPEGMNPMDYVVGVTQAPCNIPSIGNGSAVSIMIGRENTGVSGYLLANQGSYSTTTIGTYSIPKYHNNFLDYEPYTNMSLYIPYCGTINLPPALFMGAELRVDLIYDIYSGECAGVVYCNGNFYTSISGNFMSMQAVSAENTGAIKNAVIGGAFGVVGGATTAIASLATGNVVGGAIGVGAMLTSAYKSMVSLNSIAPNASAGGGGGRCNFYKPDCCILYINTPTNSTPSDFYTTHGGVLNEPLTLSNGLGFTVVSNPVITGNMTLSEKTEIENYFKSGIIL